MRPFFKYPIPGWLDIGRVQEEKSQRRTSLEGGRKPDTFLLSHEKLQIQLKSLLKRVFYESHLLLDLLSLPLLVNFLENSRINIDQLKDVQASHTNVLLENPFLSITPVVEVLDLVTRKCCPSII